MKWEVPADIRPMFNAPHRTQGKAQMYSFVDKYALSTNKLSDSLGGNIENGLRIFFFSKRALTPDPQFDGSGKNLTRYTKLGQISKYLSQRGTVTEISAGLVTGDQQGMENRQDLLII